MTRPVFGARPAWVEINLDHIAHNLREYRALTGEDTEIMAVVKADGYGHGASAVATAALQAGATRLAVAFVEEGIKLRRSGMKAPILILGYTGPEQFNALIDYDLTPAVFSYKTAQTLSILAVNRGAELPIHLKVDTGMSRVGLLPEEAVDVVCRIGRLPGLLVEGLMTHLAAADERNRDYTEGQLLLFSRIVESCREKGITFPSLHAANSAAAANYPHARLNMIRLGIALYGYYPSPVIEESSLRLIPALTFKSRVIMIKRVPAGTAVSYGCTYHTEEEALIATIPVGYADGYNRLLSNRADILIRGRRAPIAGRICMDHFMADVTSIPGVREGDEVVLYGRQGAGEISLEEVAVMTGTISYELLCAVSARVSRLYFQNGLLHSIDDFTGDLSFD